MPPAHAALAHPATQSPPASLHLGDWLALARDPSILPPRSIDLLYADLPFNTGTTQRGSGGAYHDSWPSASAYSAWLRERLLATLPALKPSANILLHIDWRACHHVRLLLDELLGEDRFVNHLIWRYGLGGSSPRRFARKHDDILFYCLDPDLYFFDPPRIPATSRRMAGMEKKATDVLDIPSLNNMSAERTGYPTQKPLALLDLLLRACSPPTTPDNATTILDPTCGSGTTLLAARRAVRASIGFDANPDAIALARQRIVAVSENPSPRSRGEDVDAQR